MTVGVQMYAEDLPTGIRHLGSRGRFVLVALDSQERPTDVPPLASRFDS